MVHINYLLYLADMTDGKKRQAFKILIQEYEQEFGKAWHSAA
jgi:hypothetical protein